MEKIRKGYTRVSSVLSQWDRYSRIPEELLENKMRIGTNVHEAIDLDNNCLPYLLEDDEQPYMDSYLKWKEGSGAKIVESEQRFYDDRLMLTGAIDAIVLLPESQQLLIHDWKCSYSEDPINWPLQAGFYNYLARSAGEKQLAYMVRFVKLDRFGGLPKIYEYEMTPDLWEKCEASLLMYRYQKPWLDKQSGGFRD